MRPYLLGSNYAGCSYVRLWIPAWNNGFMTNRKGLRAKNDDAKEVINDIQSSDIVVFHRPESKEHLNLAEIARKDGKKIVFDNDDTYYIDDNHPILGIKEDESLTLKEKISNLNEFISKADLVTCSTEFLAKEYRRLNDNVVVLKNCIDPMDWDEPLTNETDMVRIGLVGSVSMEYDYLHVKEVIRELSNNKKVQLVLFGLGSKEHRNKNPLVSKVFKNEYAFWDTIDYEHFPWCEIKDYPRLLNEARLDLMLIPRKDNYFNRCKSNLKFLEASMCEVPVIAQSFEDGPYEELTSDIGVLIKDNKDWLKEINKLINNKELRRSIGKNAREYVLKNYSIEDNAHLWADAYKTICK